MLAVSNFYTDAELQTIGFKHIGTNVKISKKASIYKPELMSIGNNVRIEDFCVLNGDITIGDNVFIAVYCLLDGHCGITLEEDVTFAAKVSVHSGTDDYSGESLVGAYVPVSYRKNHINASVFIAKHVIIGDSSVILPGVTLAEGTAVGALSFVKETTQPWGIYAGIPAKRIRERSKNLLLQYRELFNK